MSLWNTLVGLVVVIGSAQAQQDAWWGSDVDAALERAGARALAWQSALDEVPKAQRPGMQFLLAHMPERDLEALDIRTLLDEVALCYEVRSQVPWGASLPEAVWLNDVLAYCHLNEVRKPMRRALATQFLDTVKDCRTPGEAALALNSTLFGELGCGKVEYFSAGVEGTLIALAALLIFVQAGRELVRGPELQNLDRGMAAVGVLAAVNGFLGLHLIRTGRRTRSLALEADGRHLLTDVATSAGVVVGLLAVRLTGWLVLDPLVAIAVRRTSCARAGGSCAARSVG